MDRAGALCDTMNNPLTHRHNWGISFSANGRTLRLSCKKASAVAYDFSQDEVAAVGQEVYADGLYKHALTDPDVYRSVLEDGENEWVVLKHVNDVYRIVLEVDTDELPDVFGSGTSELVTLTFGSAETASDIMRVSISQSNMLREITDDAAEIYKGTYPLCYKLGDTTQFSLVMQIRAVKDISHGGIMKLWSVSIVAHPHAYLCLMSKHIPEVSEAGVPMLHKH
jgi:hypothetical protein